MRVKISIGHILVTNSERCRDCVVLFAKYDDDVIKELVIGVRRAGKPP
jgi:hypothetical protein